MPSFKIPSFRIALFLNLILLSLPSYGQDCNGGAISTKESYLYGKFEVAMQSAPGDGIVSSFFLYNIETNCNWPAENNEIDIEMTGNTELLYFTTHHPDPVQTWYYGENFDLDFNPHETLKRYSIEWEPGIVRWFVEDQLIYTQQEAATDNLHYPMAILMNLWAAHAESWVGVWDPSVLPRQSTYDYVKYYRYTPGQGNTGSNNNFTFEWEDQFDFLDTSRWEVSDFTGFAGNYCRFRANNVELENGFLKLTIDEPQPTSEMVPVTFSVNMKDYPMQSSDVVYLNGSFNDWCGTCHPMIENEGVWTKTLNLSPEKYEYLFSLNNWAVSGNAPMGSDCDYNPCDQYANYGLLVAEGSAPIVLDTYCWGACTDCLSTSTTSIPSKEKTLIKVYDLLGRDAISTPGQLLFYLYDDGSVVQKINFRTH